MINDFDSVTRNCVVCGERIDTPHFPKRRKGTPAHHVEVSA